MSQNVVKVGVASAIGAAVFCVVALVIAPVFTWYSAFCGALVGGLVGYMGYEFRTVMLTARQMGVKLFRKRTKVELLEMRYNLASGTWWYLIVYLPLYVSLRIVGFVPFVAFCIVSGALLLAALYYVMICTEPREKDRWSVSDVMSGKKRPYPHMRGLVLPWGWKSFYKLHPLPHRSEYQTALYSQIRWAEPLDDAEGESWRQLGVYQLAPTVWNMLRMRFVDAYVSCFLFIGTCVWFLSRISSGLVRLARWIRSFLRRIHSHQRVVCAESAIIGGMFDYVLLVDMSQTLTEKLFLVALGSVSGFVVGVLLWKIALSWRASEAVPAAET